MDIFTFLKDKKIPFRKIPSHKLTTNPEDTSFEAPAKVVILKVDERMCMLILPALLKINLQALKIFLEVDNIEIALHKELMPHFPDCKPEHLPPFGKLYNMDVYLLGEVKEFIRFYTLDGKDVIELKLKDYIKITSPNIV